MEIQTLEVGMINPAAYNPRKDLKPGDLEYDKLKKSILEFDMVEPLVWNKRTANLVGGHQRLKVLEEMGIKQVEVSVVDLSPIKEKALNLALNKIQGEWDFPKLKDLLEELDTGDFDIEMTGFDLKEIEDLMTQFHVPSEGLIDDDGIPEKVETICKMGDLWQLGQHRLLCGDATKKEDVERLMQGEKADIVFTDPPYGIDHNPAMSARQTRKGNWLSHPKKYNKLIGDNQSFDLSMFAWLNCQEQFWWGAENYLELPDDGSWFVWDKRTGIEDMKWSTSEFELCWSKTKHHRQIARITWSGILGTEQEFDHNEGRQHPTQKPVLLSEWFIAKFSKSDNTVIDLFGGSGSTLIACEKLGRRCFMMEIDEHYCDVIIQRWQNFTGKQAVRLDGN